VRINRSTSGAAGFAAASKRPVTLLDSDPQASSADWVENAADEILEQVTLVEALAYVWKKGDLEWVKPQVKREDVTPNVATTHAPAAARVRHVRTRGVQPRMPRAIL